MCIEGLLRTRCQQAGGSSGGRDSRQMSHVCEMWDRPGCMDSPLSRTHQQQLSAAGTWGSCVGRPMGGAAAHIDQVVGAQWQQQGVRQQLLIHRPSAASSA